MSKLKIFALINSLKHKFGFGAIDTKVIYCQAYHESGGFKSTIFHENNNCFGMKEPSIRPSTATGTNRGHATYKTVKDCLVDFFLRQSYFKINGTDSILFMHETVQSGYAEDPQYLIRWVDMVKAFDDKPFKYLS